MLPLLLTALLVSSPSGDLPFAELDYETALAQAKEKQKLLFVDFTATWCPPCKKMEHDTWPQADVFAWLKENAIAIQVDVDKQTTLAQRFSVEAMPTVVAVRGGEEFDRIVGYRDAAQFLTWAKDVAAGKRTSDELAVRAKALADSPDVDARYELARDLLRARQYDLALQHYLWLWPATREVPEMAGVRVSFMLNDMAALAQKYPPARKAFLEFLEAAQAKIDAVECPAWLDWSEWSNLCKHTGQPERVLAWYEKHRDEQGRLFAAASTATDHIVITNRDDGSALPGAFASGQRDGDLLARRIVDDVFDALMQAERPLDAVKLYPDARKHADAIVQDWEQKKASSALIAEEHRKEFEEYSTRKLTDDLCEYYAALLAAERGAEAADVGALLVSKLDTPDTRLALVRAGLSVARGPDANLTRWLNEAEAAGANGKTLRRKLERLGTGKADASEAGGESSGGGK